MDFWNLNNAILWLAIALFIVSLTLALLLGLKKSKKPSLTNLWMEILQGRPVEKNNPNTKYQVKVRPGILLGEMVIAAGIVTAMMFNFEKVALVLAGGLCTLLPKLVESEEKGK